MRQSLRLVLRSFAATFVLVTSACAAPDIAAVVQPTTVTGAVGQQVVIDFRRGGGAPWDSIPVVVTPPMASSPAVKFVSSIPDVPPYSPGGSTQRFTFLALAHGYVTVTFTHATTTDSKTYVIEVP